MVVTDSGFYDLQLLVQLLSILFLLLKTRLLVYASCVPNFVVIVAGHLVRVPDSNFPGISSFWYIYAGIQQKKFFHDLFPLFY